MSINNINYSLFNFRDLCGKYYSIDINKLMSWNQIKTNIEIKYNIEINKIIMLNNVVTDLPYCNQLLVEQMVNEKMSWYNKLFTINAVFIIL